MINLGNAFFWDMQMRNLVVVYEIQLKINIRSKDVIINESKMFKRIVGELEVNKIIDRFEEQQKNIPPIQENEQQIQEHEDQQVENDEQ